MKGGREAYRRPSVTLASTSAESWAQHMTDPKLNASMLREHARSIRQQLKLLDKLKRYCPMFPAQQAVEYSNIRQCKLVCSD